MNRRSFFSSLLVSPLAIAGMARGATALKRGDKCVLVFDPARVSMKAAQGIGQSLGLPEGTRIIPVHCREGEYPEEAFALLEAKENAI